MLHKWEPPTASGESPKVQPISIICRIVAIQAAHGMYMHHVNIRKALGLQQIQSTHHINFNKYQKKGEAEWV